MLDVSDRLSGRDPLDVVASKILIHWKESEDQRLTAALLLREAKGRVEAGEDEHFATFQAWCSEKLPGRSERDIRRLLLIANSPDPISYSPQITNCERPGRPNQPTLLNLQREVCSRLRVP